MNLTTNAANRVLDWLVNQPTTAPVAPLYLRLMVITGDANSAGTQVSGGGYTPQVVTFGPATAGGTTNSSVVTFANMPACVVVGAEIWDSVGFRWQWGLLTASQTFTAGQTATLNLNDQVLTAA